MPEPAPAPTIQVVRNADRPLVPWRNGKGLTRDIATRISDAKVGDAKAGTAGALLWQVGVAELTGDADFSDFTGCDRLFTPLGPVELAFDDGAWLPCPALLPVAFAGERRTRLRLPHGRAQAFNVITGRATHRARGGPVQLPAGGTLPLEFAGTGVLHCVAGLLRLPDGERLQPGETALAEPGWHGALAAPDRATLLLAEITAMGR